MKKIFCFFLILYVILCNKALASEQTLIIFDASVSMLEPFGSTQKYIAAINAAKNQLSKIDSQKQVGLRIIGITIDSAIMSFFINPDYMCKATKLVVPISAYNIENINKNLDTIFPMGITPLTYTLKTAVDYDFDINAYPKHIILITDGAESCDADPCSYIKNIMLKRNDIKIDVIAITVNQNDYNLLKCLTENTGGRIITVNDDSEFDNAFSSVMNNKPSLNNIRQYPVPVQQKNPDNYIPSRQQIKYKNYLIETSS